MKIFAKIIIYIFIFTLLFSGCKKKENVEEASYKTQTVSKVIVEELPFPLLPPDIHTPQEKADYLLMHFWDEMNFTDTVRSRNEDFLAQNFVNFIALFPFANNDSRFKASRYLLNKAKADTVAFEKLTEVIHRYLYDVESPMLSEENYIPFLQALIEDPFPDNSTGESAEITLGEIMKNRVGSIAADFNYITRDDKSMSLYTTPSGKDLMLIFYDPECEVCKGVIRKLSNDAAITQRIEAGELTIVAIYSGEKKEIWEKEVSNLPENWIVGYEPGEIDRKEIYILRASPTIYLLNGDTKEVIVKDMIFK